MAIAAKFGKLSFVDKAIVVVVLLNLVVLGFYLESRVFAGAGPVGASAVQETPVGDGSVGKIEYDEVTGGIYFTDSTTGQRTLVAYYGESTGDLIPVPGAQKEFTINVMENVGGSP